MDKFCPFNLSKEELEEYTPEWKGDRFSDGRPKVSDGIIERMKSVTIDQAWIVLTNEGYNWQYEGGFMCTCPGQVLAGRAVTALYMPRRPDMRLVMEEKGKKYGCVGDQISWPIDLLVPGDVYVADVFGKIKDGPIIGDNLSTAIYAKSQNGVVHNAAVRDIEGIKKIPGFVSFSRGYSPTYASPTIMLLGINIPTRIGSVTVMPGDVILGKDNGVIFIPPHLVEKVVKTSELVRLRDDFGKTRLKEDKYTPGQIDDTWTDEIEKDFSCWLQDHLDKLPVPREEIEELLRERTW